MFISEKCGVVSFESTSDFLVPLYDLLIQHLLAVIESAGDMKALYTQIEKINLDYKIIAKIALNQSFDVESCCKQWVC